MMIAASKEEFELAASLRDQMFALERMIERQIAVVQKTEEADVFVYWLKITISFFINAGERFQNIRF